MSAEEWASLPYFFGSEDGVKVFGTSRRYLLEHAAELGGVLIGGKWQWCKGRVSQMFGLGTSEAEGATA